MAQGTWLLACACMLGLDIQAHRKVFWQLRSDAEMSFNVEIGQVTLIFTDENNKGAVAC